MISEDPAEEDALRYRAPLVDNWYSDEVDSGAGARPSSQVRVLSVCTTLQYSNMWPGVAASSRTLPP
jgi:hypothetical protein